MNQDDGRITASPEQRLNCIKQGCLDIMKCVEKILIVHGRGILDYAVWHRERLTNEDNYGTYIMRIACHSIVHSDFMAPNITWEMVEFS